MVDVLFHIVPHTVGMNVQEYIQPPTEVPYATDGAFTVPQQKGGCNV